MRTNKTLALVVLILAALLLLGACTRSATGKVEFTPVPQVTAFPTPVPLNGTGEATVTPTATEVQKVATQVGEASPTPKPTPKPKPKPKPTHKPSPTKAPTKAPTSVPKHNAGVQVPSKYVLHKGEYPYCIARRFDIDPDALLRANNLRRGQWVYPGTELVIPKNAGHFPYQRAWHSHPTDYTVRYGDTIYSIACWFGDVTPEEIAAANGISVNTPLTPGQVLHIP